MKNLALAASLVVAFFIGRWTTAPIEITQTVEKIKKIKTTELIQKECKSVGFEKEVSQSPQKCSLKDLAQNQKFLRTEGKKKNHLMQKLAGQLAKAQSKGDLEEENRIFKEMLELNPVHKIVFQTKVMYLQNDGDWEGAKDVLKQCAEVHPDYLYCQRRLANIRSSSVEDKIKHGQECLRLKKDDALCHVDLAIAYKIDGQLEKSKNLLEKALELPKQAVGFDRRYILYIYGMVLEDLSLYQEALSALEESCELKLNAACQMLKRSERKTS